MIRKKQKIDDSGPCAPAYMVTFSDMVTLLLTFFVMLMSFAVVKDETMFHRGRDSFVESINLLGMGFFTGKKPKAKFSYHKPRYTVSEADENFDGRTIDAMQEQARRDFRELQRSMKTMPSQITAKQKNLAVTNIRFPPSDAAIDESARRELTKFASDLGENPNFKNIKLCVIGVAADAGTDQESFVLSAKRAKAAADLLKGALPAGCPIYSWGAANGGPWLGQSGSAYAHAHILIAVLRAN
ncbi:MAG TPA: flagellar motor protein MotB [Sedimentisphaerales bacterium]|nr:flagellar motor protein MotB [Sedimentisphaerales bacterium]